MAEDFLLGNPSFKEESLLSITFWYVTLSHFIKFSILSACVIVLCLCYQESGNQLLSFTFVSVIRKLSFDLLSFTMSQLSGSQLLSFTMSPPYGHTLLFKHCLNIYGLTLYKHYFLLISVDPFYII